MISEVFKNFGSLLLPCFELPGYFCRLYPHSEILFNHEYFPMPTCDTIHVTFHDLF